MHYTNPKALDIRSDEMMNFVNDADVTKEDIVSVIEAIRNIREIHLKRARVGMRTAKVKQLIIAGHSLGGAYATYLFLRLYGDDYTRKAPDLMYY